tara:strand:+ start:700 stop:1662 length:963 start_codon:yes stop_codon:yes gene_type:complete
MSVHTLDIDSGERDPIAYPNPGDYVVELKNPIYNVSKISLVSARIHASQLLINDRNNTFSVNGTTVTLPNENYSGNEIASELFTQFQSSSLPITSVTYDKSKNDIIFGGTAPFTFEFYGGVNGFANTSEGLTTPHDILGLPASNVSSVNNTITTGSINLQGPDALILKISSGAEELNKTVYSDTPFYTGRILMCGDVINYSGIDDTVEHNFESGSQNISKLRIQFFYSSNNRLIPYDFRNANHVLKLSINGVTDKLSRVPMVKKGTELQNEERTEGCRLPPNIQGKADDLNKWNAFIYIFLIILTGCFFMVFTKPRRLSE